jgi:hypothetical protein
MPIKKNKLPKFQGDKKGSQYGVGPDYPYHAITNPTGYRLTFSQAISINQINKAKQIRKQIEASKTPAQKAIEELRAKGLKDSEIKYRVEMSRGYNPNKSWASQANLAVDNSFLSKLTRGKNMMFNEDYTQNLGPVVGRMANWTRNLMHAPAAGVVDVARGLAGDQNLQNESAVEKAAGWDITGFSNYPYLKESLQNLGQTGKAFYQKPSWEGAGNVLTATIPAAFNALGSLPLIGAAEKNVLQAGVKETPKLFSGFKSLVSPSTYTRLSRGQRGLIPFKQLSNAEKAQVIIRAPFVETGRAAKTAIFPTLGAVADATTLPFNVTKIATESPLSKLGLGLKEGVNIPVLGHPGPWIRGEKVWKNETGTTPFEQVWDRAFPENEQPAKQTNYPVNPDQGSYIPQVYQQPTITKDTTINFLSPSGKVYSINTGSADYKEVFDKIISRDKSNWDPKTRSFKIDPKEFVDADGNPIDVDEAMQQFTQPQKRYGGMAEIPNLFGYEPDSALPKGQFGGECPDGQEYNPNTGKCEVKNYSTLTTVPAISSAGMTGGFNWSDPSGLGGMGAPQEGPSASSFMPTYNAIDSQGNVTPTNKNNFYLDDNNKSLYQIDPAQTTKTNLFNLKGKKKRSFGDLTDKMVDFGETLRAGANAVSFLQDQYITNPMEQKDWNKTFRERKFTAGLKPIGTGRRGYYDINTGTLLDQDTGYKTQNFGQFGGMMLNNSDMDKKKIIIKVVKDNDEMAYGGQLGFGLDLGQRGTYSPMPKTKSEEVGKTMPEVPREQANIEAEKGETVYADVDGDGMYEHMNIGGERHTNGGTPLNVPEGSFVFSDTKKMTIKDPATLKNFGLSPRKEGYTPAEIAKKYDINKYKAIVEDPTVDYMQKNTAQMMIKNYQRKLAELALVQEEMKGFPQGIPQMAMEVLPEELLAQVQETIDAQKQEAPISPEVEQNMPEEVESEEEAMADQNMEEQEPTEEELISMYGGDIFEYGGMLDPFQGGGTKKNKWQEKIDKIKALKKQTAWSERYGKGDTEIAEVQSATGTGVYGEMTDADVEDFKKRHQWYFKNHPDWDATNQADVKDFQTNYNIRAIQKGMDFNFFDPSSTEMDALDGLFGEYTYNAPDLSDEPETPQPVTGWTCTGRDANNQPQLVGPTDYPDETARKAAGAVASAQEAMKLCPPKPDTPSPGTIDEKKPPTSVPFKYMTPDMWKAAGIAGTRINKYLPFIPDTPFESGQFIPEDWRGKASQLQSLARQTGEQIGTFTGGPQSVANLTNVFAQQAPNLIGAISDVDARNIAGVNQFNNIEQQRRDKAALLRSANQVERYKGNVVANQQYDNSLNTRNMALADMMANAWNNRMNLGLTNATNKFYYTDPRSGRTIFKGGYGPEDINGNTASSSWDDLQKDRQRAMDAGFTADEWMDMRGRTKKASTTTSKYGGGIGRKKITPLSAVGKMLGNGYGFPF